MREPAVVGSRVETLLQERCERDLHEFRVGVERGVGGLALAAVAFGRCGSEAGHGEEPARRGGVLACAGGQDHAGVEREVWFEEGGEEEGAEEVGRVDCSQAFGGGTVVGRGACDTGIVDEDVDRLGAPGGGEGADGVEGGCVEREDADALRAAFAAGFDDLCCGLFGFGGATASEVDGRVAFCQREGKRVADS